MSNTEDTMQGVPPVAPQPKRVVQLGIPVLISAVLLVLVLGFLGGLVAQSLFPPKDGHRGARGPQGVAGVVGPVGPAGSAANVDWATHGLCFNSGTSTYSFSNDPTIPPLLTNAYAYLSTPTVTNGTQSCGSGTFVPLENPPSTP